MSDDQGNQPSGGDAGTERALDELRAALEQLASRMGAGFREDLAQIRAIAASVAERDLTADVQALRVDVASLVGRSDEAGVDRVLQRFDALDSRLDRLAGADGSAELVARIDALAARIESQPASHDRLLVDLQDNLADVASGEVVGALWDEVRRLRADLPELIVAPPAATPEVDPQLAVLTDELAFLRSELAEGLVVEPSEALSASLDALRGEVDGLRDALADLRATPAPEADRSGDEQVRQQLEAVQTGIDDLHARLEGGLVLGDDAEAAGDGSTAVIDAVAEQVAALRGFVGSEIDTVRQVLDARLAEVAAAPVESPTTGRADTVAAVVDAVRDQVAVLQGFVTSELDGVRQTMATRLDAVAEETAAAVAATPQADDGGADRVSGQLDAIRAGIEELQARLDEVPDPAPVDDVAEPRGLSGDAPAGADVEAIADQIAALRDFVSSELDTMQQTLSARLDAAAEATATTVAAAVERPEPEPGAPEAAAAGIDPETVELLRDEIRTAGAIGDQVVDALREELKALRRRIAVKASERVLDDQQLAQIADAVAARLAADGGDA